MATVNIGFREMCCDHTTEAGADELYILVAARKNDGTPVTLRLPSDSPNQPQGHWDMNDGGQPTDNPAGDSHCITNKTLLTTSLNPGESLDALVLVMEEDGGSTKTFQEVGATALAQTGNPIAAGAGAILGALTALGFTARDSDDFIGSFGVNVVNQAGNLAVQWTQGDRVVHMTPDPSFGGDPNRREIRFNGDGSNYVGWFYVG